MPGQPQNTRPFSILSQFLTIAAPLSLPNIFRLVWKGTSVPSSKVGKVSSSGTQEPPTMLSIGQVSHCCRNPIAAVCTAWSGADPMQDVARHPPHSCCLRPPLAPTGGVCFLSSKCLAALWLAFNTRMWWKPVLGQALGGQAASAFCLSEASLHAKMLRLTTEWRVTTWGENGHMEKNKPPSQTHLAQKATSHHAPPTSHSHEQINGGGYLANTFWGDLSPGNRKLK